MSFEIRQLSSSTPISALQTLLGVLFLPLSIYLLGKALLGSHHYTLLVTIVIFGYRHRPLDLTQRQMLPIMLQRKDKASITVTDADVRCDLITIDLADAPPYKAVSYIQGSPPPDCST